jgi:hypothetical protein
MKFRTKPVEIEACRWATDLTWPQWMKDAWDEGVLFAKVPDHDAIFVKTMEGEMRADRGDWLIRGVKGELYPCRDDIFRMTYEPVADNAA